MRPILTWTWGTVAAASLLAALASALGTEVLPSGNVLIAIAAISGAATVALGTTLATAPVTSPSMLFTTAVLLFHTGLIVPWAIGIEDAPRWLANAPRGAFDQALRCLVIAFTALQLGLLFGWRRFDRRPPSLQPTIRARSSASALHGGGLAVALLSFVAAFANLLTIGIGRFFGDSYGHEIFDATDSRLLQTCLFWALPAGLLLALAGAREGRERNRARLFIGCTTLLFLWLGNRGDAVALAGAAAVIHTYTCGAVPLRIAAPAATATLAVLALVAIVRQLPRASVSAADLREAAARATPTAALAEMGWTLRPLVDTIRLVPDQVPFRGGQSYTDAALRLLPNLATQRADASWNDPLRLPPNHWITYEVEPWTHAAFGGLGYSAVAEPYLNFGVFGVAGYFLLAGWLLGRTDRELARGPARRHLALAAVVLMPLLVTARNDFHNFVRPAVWGIALVAIVERAHGDRRRSIPAPLGSPA